MEQLQVKHMVKPQHQEPGQEPEYIFPPVVSSDFNAKHQMMDTMYQSRTLSICFHYFGGMGLEYIQLYTCWPEQVAL